MTIRDLPTPVVAGWIVSGGTQLDLYGSIPSGFPLDTLLARVAPASTPSVTTTLLGFRDGQWVLRVTAPSLPASADLVLGFAAGTNHGPQTIFHADFAAGSSNPGSNPQPLTSLLRLAIDAKEWLLGRHITGFCSTHRPMV